ncbi:MAG: DUF5343 domain-containing protein [Brevinematales bacterium]|nr:DUF5343 domain-containing protein [Brevinematales bacterium]
MEKTQNNEKKVYPKIPETNWWALRNQFNKSLPTKVNASYLKSLLNLATDSAARNLINHLEQIKIIDSDGKPTDRANNWRIDSSYSQTCKEILKEVYPQELIDLYSGNDVNRELVKEWFKNSAALGDNTAGQCASLYIILNNAKVKTSEETKKSIQKSKVQNPPKNETPHKISQKNLDSDDIPAIHLNLQIHISPEANSEQIETIFSNLAKYIYRK